MENLTNYNLIDLKKETEKIIRKFEKGQISSSNYFFKEELNENIQELKTYHTNQCQLSTTLIRYALSFILENRWLTLNEIYNEIYNFFGENIICEEDLTPNVNTMEPKWKKQVRNTLAKMKQLNQVYHENESSAYILDDQTDFRWK